MKTARVDGKVIQADDSCTWYEAAIRAAKQFHYAGKKTVTVTEGDKVRELDVRCECVYIVDDVRDLTNAEE